MINEYFTIGHYFAVFAFIPLSFYSAWIERDYNNNGMNLAIAGRLAYLSMAALILYSTGVLFWPFIVGKLVLGYAKALKENN